MDKPALASRPCPSNAFGSNSFNIYNGTMISLLTAFFASFFTTLLIIRFKHLHSQFSGDHDLLGPQKFHTGSVPRIGGISIAIGILAAVLINLQNTEVIG